YAENCDCDREAHNFLPREAMHGAALGGVHDRTGQCELVAGPAIKIALQPKNKTAARRRLRDWDRAGEAVTACGLRPTANNLAPYQRRCRYRCRQQGKSASRCP